MMGRLTPRSERGGAGRPYACLDVERLESRALPSATGNSAYVTQVFRDLLGHDPDPTVLSQDAAQLDQGKITRGQFALSVESTPEYRADEVQAIFAAYLHHAPDPDTLNRLVGVLNAGGTVEQVSANVLGSSEYYQVRGGGTPGGFLDALYADLVGHPADPTTRGELSRALAHGLSRTVVAGAVLNSPAHQQQIVEGIYERFLHRPADPQGLSGGAAFLRHGGHDEAFAAGIIGSDEYFGRLDPAADPPLLTPTDVGNLLSRAAAATSSDDGIVAVVDRAGHILGVRVEGNVSPAITGNTEKLVFAIDGAVALARTAAFFSSDQAPLTSRTIRSLSQSTITQREVESDPSITDPNSTAAGPGFVAPVGVGGHFPPNVMFTPPVDLYDIEFTNRDKAPTTPNTERFNIPLQFVPAGQQLDAPVSYGVASGLEPNAQSRGIGTLPGGIPLFKDGTLVGGIGVFFPGTTGFADAENSSLSTTNDPSKPDRSLEAEYDAFVAAGGAPSIGFAAGTVGGVPADGFALPAGRIDLVGITLDIYGPEGLLGPKFLVTYGKTLGQGDPNSSAALAIPLSGTAGHPFAAGQAIPDGWLVTPHAGGGLSADNVTQIIQQGIAQASVTRAAIRLPLGRTTKMVFAVSDKQGNLLGLYRMPDATVFSIDVAVAKARNVAYYDDPAQLQPADQVPGVAPGVAFTARTFRFLAQPRYPEGIDGEPPGAFSILNDGGSNPITGLNDGPPLPKSAFNSVEGFVAFNPQANFHDPVTAANGNQNGVVFFPGSSPVYGMPTGTTMLLGGLGVSGDGVTQDDTITFKASAGYATPGSVLRADQVFVRDVRLPYMNFVRNPDGL
jgi:uncharacterized protein GlcG (DUF336 family)